MDPFTLSEFELSCRAVDFPPASSIDIVSYLVLTTSFYTNNQMKTFKSVNDYKYFEGGFVHRCGAGLLYTIIIAFIVFLVIKFLNYWLINNHDDYDGVLLYVIEHINTYKAFHWIIYSIHLYVEAIDFIFHKLQIKHSNNFNK